MTTQTFVCTRLEILPCSSRVRVGLGKPYIATWESDTGLTQTTRGYITWAEPAPALNATRKFDLDEVERDLAHEHDMAMLRKEQLAADISPEEAEEADPDDHDWHGY